MSGLIQLLMPCSILIIFRTYRSFMEKLNCIQFVIPWRFFVVTGYVNRSISYQQSYFKQTPNQFQQAFPDIQCSTHQELSLC